MKRRSRNQSLTSSSERRKKFLIEGVVKRGSNETWIAFRRWISRFVKVTFLAALTAGIYWACTEGFQKFFWRNPP